jgi:hypothetical protein
MADKIDFTITIKGIPAKEAHQLWTDNMKFMMDKMGEVAEYSEKVTIDFDYAMGVHPEGFFQILAAGFTFQAMKTGKKIVKE